MAAFLEIHSPQSPTQCVPTTFSWNGGIAPYTLKITAVTGDSQIGDVLQTFSGIGNQSLQWPVNLSGGTEFGIVLSDSTPITVQFVPVTVQAGPDSSCLGSSSTFSSSTSASSAAATSSSSNPQSTGTPTMAASGLSTSRVSETSSAPSSSSSVGPTGLPAAVAASASKVLSGGAIAGIAIAAALGGVLMAALFYWMWKRYGRRRIGSPRTLDLNESSLPPAQPPRTSKAAEARVMRQSLLRGSPMSSPSPTTASFAQYPSGVSGAYTEPSVYTPTPGTSRTPSASRRSATLPQQGRLSVLPSSDEDTSTARSSNVGEMHARGLQVVSWAVSSSGQSVQESDAGVRLAGGPPLPPILVTEASESGSLPDGAPIPPPYRRYEE